MKVIDHCETWTPGLGKKMKSAGITHVGRYQGIGGSWKHLTPAEAKDYRDNGIDIFTIMEGSANRVRAGFAAGAADAKETLAAMKLCGAPAGAFVWAGCDYEAPASDWPAIKAYLEGAGGPTKVGLYGGRVICELAQKAGYRIWQTHAWSGSPVTYWIPGADMYQRNDWGYTYYGGFLNDYDANEVKKADFGQWGATAPVVTPPTPPPVEGPAVDYKKKMRAALKASDGITEKPMGSNNVKFNTWYYGHPVSGAAYPWCMADMSWHANEAGILPLIGGKSVSTVQTSDWFKKRGQWSTKPQEDSLVFYDLPGGKNGIEHVGYVVKVEPGWIWAWEGNTSDTEGGSQSNGGGHFLKHRPLSVCKGFGIIKWPAATVVPKPPVFVPDSTPVPDAGAGAVYRLRDSNTDYLLTSNLAEARSAQHSYRYEGVAFRLPIAGEVVVQRLFKSGRHFYSADKVEIAAQAKAGWAVEGPAFAVATSGAAVMRYYNGVTWLWTADAAEAASLKAPWKLEGVAWYV